MEEDRLYDLYAIDEDIKILEDLIMCSKEQYKEINKHLYLQDYHIEALEHLIEAYRKVKEENKFISEEKWKADEAVIFLTERLENSYKNSIPKSKIKEKIEEYKQEADEEIYPEGYSIVDAFQELLEEE